MEEKHKCKFCSRSFGNGRALGGHIRSHTQNLNKERRTLEEEARPIPSSSLISPHSRRSKRIRKSRFSGTLEDEDVAYCLMMLSKDKWVETEDEKSDEEVKKGKKKLKFYRCETCNKLFRSYQALGGHMANHKKMIRANKEGEGGVENGNNGIAGGESEKIHECPICYKVFASGQALGGHKRSHFSGSMSSSASFSPEASSSSTPINIEKQLLSRTAGTLIDLNLPAPMVDDGYDDEDNEEKDEDVYEIEDEDEDDLLNYY